MTLGLLVRGVEQCLTKCSFSRNTFQQEFCCVSVEERGCWCSYHRYNITNSCSFHRLPMRDSKTRLLSPNQLLYLAGTRIIQTPPQYRLYQLVSRDIPIRENKNPFSWLLYPGLSRYPSIVFCFFFCSAFLLNRIDFVYSVFRAFHSSHSRTWVPTERPSSRRTFSNVS